VSEVARLNPSLELTPREHLLLELVASGLTDRRIGLRLGRSPITVKHQVQRLRGKLRVRSRVELAAWAGARGFYRRPVGRSKET
jgi:DNA-binding NarL/FixJ family response regulator